MVKICAQIWRLILFVERMQFQINLSRIFQKLKGCSLVKLLSIKDPLKMNKKKKDCIFLIFFTPVPCRIGVWIKVRPQCDVLSMEFCVWHGCGGKMGSPGITWLIWCDLGILLSQFCCNPTSSIFWCSLLFISYLSFGFCTFVGQACFWSFILAFYLLVKLTDQLLFFNHCVQAKTSGSWLRMASSLGSPPRSTQGLVPGVWRRPRGRDVTLDMVFMLWLIFLMWGLNCGRNVVNLMSSLKAQVNSELCLKPVITTVIVVHLATQVKYGPSRIWLNLMMIWFICFYVLGSF